MIILDKKPSRCDEFWYDLSSGGYLSGEDFSSDPYTIQKIDEAVALLMECENVIEDGVGDEEE